MKILINLIMYPAVVVGLLAVFIVMLVSMIPLVPFVVLAMPAVIANDASLNRVRWDMLTGWKRTLVTPYLSTHKFIVEKIWRKKQRF